jgi:hypothetical protein
MEAITENPEGMKEAPSTRKGALDMFLTIPNQSSSEPPQTPPVRLNW